MSISTLLSLQACIFTDGANKPTFDECIRRKQLICQDIPFIKPKVTQESDKVPPMSTLCVSPVGTLANQNVMTPPTLN